ncbi:MAG: thioredoxin [Bacteroidales bacterium]|nr:thioredoxin [Bacteroidales bacterium]
MKKLFFISLLIILGITGKAVAQVNTVVSLTGDEFKKKVIDYTDPNAKYNGTLPVIVDFYANWCRPCKMLAPILDDLAEEYAGKIIIYKVDVDSEKAFSQAVGIRSMPTIFFFPVDDDPSYVIGFHTKDEMKELIESVLTK